MFWYFADNCYLGFDAVQGWNVLIFCSNILVPSSQRFNSFRLMLNWRDSEIVSQRPHYLRISHCLKTWECLFLEFYTPTFLKKTCALSINFVAMIGGMPSKVLCIQNICIPPRHFSTNLQLFSDPGTVSNTLLPDLEHLISAQCKSPKASQCLNFYCVLFLITTRAFVRSCHKLKTVCQAWLM